MSSEGPVRLDLVIEELVGGACVRRRVGTRIEIAPGAALLKVMLFRDDRLEPVGVLSFRTDERWERVVDREELERFYASEEGELFAEAADELEL